MKILVAGGKGFLGSHLVERLRQRGDEVWVASRHPIGEHEVGYDELPASIDAVVNLAGESIFGRWTARRRAAILSSRVQTTRLLVDWITDMPGRVPSLINASAVGYYGDRPGERLTECSSPDPARSFRSVVCQAWEAEALRAADAGARVCIARLGVVLGPGGLPQASASLMARLPVVPAVAPDSVVPWVSLDEAIDRLIEMIDEPRMSGIYNVVSRPSKTVRQLATEISNRTGKPYLPISGYLARWVLGEMAASLTDSQHVVATRTKAASFDSEV